MYLTLVLTLLIKIKLQKKKKEKLSTIFRKIGFLFFLERIEDTYPKLTHFLVV